MGNKSTCEDVRVADVCSAQRNSLRPRCSDENYIPMPWTMKKALVEGKRFRHVKPSREDVLESSRVPEKRDERGSGALIDLLRCSPSGVSAKSEGGVTKSVVKANQDSHSSVEVFDMLGSVEPIVTVLNANSSHSKSRSQTNPPISKSNNESYTSENLKHLQKSPTLTNRRYSLIDMRTGLKKSKFTLELEERLRQSKFDLGFDADLNDWKEFSYTMENPESRKRVESLKKGQLRLFGLEENVGKGLETVCLRDPLQYCAHNCQILGLCSVRSPDLLPKKETFEPLVLKDEISRKYNEVQGLLKGDLEHHKRDDCNCDTCMLAYLTEMGFPEDDSKSQCVSARKGRSPKDSPKSGRRRVKERIRIVENENTRKSIEISVSARPSTANSLSQALGEDNSQSNLSAGTSIDEDITNKRIRRMFRKNNATVNEIYDNRNETKDDGVSIVNLASVEDIFKSSGFFSERSKEVLPTQNGVRRAPLTRRRCGSNGKRSSSSTLGMSVSSSLSSILSYKRVRQIFQSIIERNRRPKKNINKFRELEELGLGEVKNNRWYPSDSKTFSIWHGMHQSVQGIQAEFKKYPRTYLKRLD